MIKHVAATLTLFIILTRASIVERFDSSIDDSLFLSEQGPVDDPLDLFTDEPIAGAPPPDCHADGDTDNLFSNDIARVRTRRNSDECLPPLPPNILNLYDSTQMLNILSGDTVPETPGIDNSATDKKSSIFPDVGLDTTNEKQKKKCPDLYDGFTFPVCSSVNFRRDDLRYPKDYHWTLFNARYWFSIAPCVTPETFYCCVRIQLEPHPLDPWPKFPSVNTGFVCYTLGRDNRLEFSRPDPATDPGKPLYRDDGTPYFPPPILP